MEKIWRRINDWKNKLLSMAGKEVLVKAVLQAIPVYMMSVYRFPQRTLDDIEKLNGQFWWDKAGRKGISWIRRETLQRKKEDEGIGFKDLRSFNEAILIKICWRIITQPHLLVSRVLKARYCQGRDLYNARLGRCPSHIWRGVMKNLEMFLTGLDWDEGKNRFIWSLSSNGVFTVRSAYDLMMKYKCSNRPDEREQSSMTLIRKFWNTIWKCEIPNKIKIFCWRLYHEALPDAKNLIRRRVEFESYCQICGGEGESAAHIVKDC
ncbi:unnamed protein product [Rhodiola kirilowii]